MLEVPASQLALAAPLAVAPANVPEVETQPVPGVSTYAPEQLSLLFATAVVIKFDDAEKFPVLEHTACTWNSYDMDALNPVTALEVVAEVVLIQVADAVGLYCTL
jgi:hypothetical protein